MTKKPALVIASLRRLRLSSGGECQDLPVIAYGAGGVLDTRVPYQTGVFFKPADAGFNRKPHSLMPVKFGMGFI